MFTRFVPLLALIGLIAGCTPDGAAPPQTGGPDAIAKSRPALGAPGPEPSFDVALGKPQRSEKLGEKLLEDLRSQYSVLAQEPSLALVPGAGTRPEIRVQRVTQARGQEICAELRAQRFKACKVLPRAS